MRGRGGGCWGKGIIFIAIQYESKQMPHKSFQTANVHLMKHYFSATSYGVKVIAPVCTSYIYMMNAVLDKPQSSDSGTAT